MPHLHRGRAATVHSQRDANGDRTLDALDTLLAGTQYVVVPQLVTTPTPIHQDHHTQRR
jgi:hypothetical protein